MKRKPKLLTGLLLCLSTTFATQALVPSQPNDHYQTIPNRNLFALKPPIQEPYTAPPPQLQKILLTGITTILGDKRALMKTVPAGAKPGEPAREQSLILSEGQGEGDVQVLSIDAEAGSVKVNNAGTVMTLTFEKDGAKLPTMPPIPTNSPGIPVYGSGIGIPGAIPAMGLASNSPPGTVGDPRLRGFPRRNLRMPLPSGGVSPPSSAGSLSAPGGTGSITPPASAVASPTPDLSLPADLTPEEQAIILEMKKQANQADSTSSQLPPTGAAQGAAPGSTQPVLPQ
jgi:hypothetical protein